MSVSAGFLEVDVLLFSLIATQTRRDFPTHKSASVRQLALAALKHYFTCYCLSHSPMASSVTRPWTQLECVGFADRRTRRLREMFPVFLWGRAFMASQVSINGTPVNLKSAKSTIFSVHLFDVVVDRRIPLNESVENLHCLRISR